MKEAQDRPKSFVDLRRRNLESEIGDLILDKCLVFRIELSVWITEIRSVSRISEGVRVRSIFDFRVSSLGSCSCWVRLEFGLIFGFVL